ncbi:MAG: hypothetical protein IT483_03385 [Gammaproteobacteria bacterium]|nr:hypothetical protein [Gammaproteobacteria bacterium]
MRHTVDFLYSLYDALVSINVPNDKARAVVDAMERDMATTLATKQDLEITGKDLLGLSKDLHSLRVELKQDLHSLRAEFKQELQYARSESKQDLQSLRSELKHDMALLRSDMEARFARNELRMTIRLAVLLAGYTGVMFAGLRLYVT